MTINSKGLIVICKFWVLWNDHEFILAKQ